MDVVTTISHLYLPKTSEESTGSLPNRSRSLQLLSPRKAATIFATNASAVSMDPHLLERIAVTTKGRRVVSSSRMQGISPGSEPWQPPLTRVVEAGWPERGLEECFLWGLHHNQQKRVAAQTQISWLPGFHLSVAHVKSGRRPLNSDVV